MLGLQRMLGKPLRLLINGRTTVVMGPDSKLYPRHLNRRGDGTPGDPPVADVVKHPTQDLYGLRNLGAQQWFATPQGSNTSLPIGQGQSIKLHAGTRIDFGMLDAVVEK